MSTKQIYKIHGATIGIFGLIKIGGYIVKTDKGFDMTVIDYRKHGKNIQIDN